MRPFLVLGLTVFCVAPALAEDARLQKLETALKTSSSYKVRATAAVAMGQLGDPQSAENLAESLRRDNHYAVRAAAASALGRLKAEAGIAPLLDALDDEDPIVAREAGRALEHLHIVALQGAFAQHIGDASPDKRNAVVAALGAIVRQKGAEPSPLLLVALSDNNATVAQTARQAFDRLNHERALPMLIAGLSDERTETRVAAAQMLARRTDRRAVVPLTEALRRNGESRAVRAEVRAALTQHSAFINLPDVVKNLSADDKTVRARALAVLMTLGDASQRAAAARLLTEDKDSGVRATAAQALLESGDPKARGLVEAAAKNERDERMARRFRSLLKASGSVSER